MQGGDNDDLVTGINVTPLVDITLVLLIVFMVTATFVSEQGLQVVLPKVATQENAPTPAITVSIGSKGELRIMKKKDTELGGTAQADGDRSPRQSRGQGPGQGAQGTDL